MRPTFSLLQQGRYIYYWQPQGTTSNSFSRIEKARHAPIFENEWRVPSVLETVITAFQTF